ncbi:MAG: hypothetical protein K2L77_08270 [Muribaculaceae bacterium]|nr:hypothetical protein [Muribaculaceae bacterium]
MKHLLSILLLLLCTSSFLFAAEPLEDPGTGKDFKPQKPRPTDAGEENNVWYTYANGLLTINFEQSEGRATMSIARMEDAHTATTSFYTMAPYTYNIGTTPGTYTLVIKTSQQQYEALLVID